MRARVKVFARAIVVALLGHYQSQQSRIWVITRKLQMSETTNKHACKRTSRNLRKKLYLVCKPLFIGSIPVPEHFCCKLAVIFGAPYGGGALSSAQTTVCPRKMLVYALEGVVCSG